VSPRYEQIAHRLPAIEWAWCTFASRTLRKSFVHARLSPV